MFLKQLVLLLVILKNKLIGQFYTKEKKMALEEMGINMPPEAKQALSRPSEKMKVVLMSRLAEMSPEELQSLDRVITPEVLDVIMKLLPELGALIEQVMQSDPQEDMPPQEMAQDDVQEVRVRQDEMSQEDMNMAGERMPEEDMGALANMT
tara:strand:+ start:92 stop:544 length:453 start_codon:yes stop_codon:yes gene_type:complete